MAVHLWDYLAEYEAERDDVLAAVDHVLRSGGRLILGKRVHARSRRRLISQASQEVDLLSGTRS